MPQPARAGPRARPTAPARWGHVRTRSRRVAIVMRSSRPTGPARLGMRSLNRSSAVFLELVITLWRQPCCYATCLSPRTPRRDTFEMRCKVYSMWRQLSKQRARPLDIEGWPEKSTLSHLKTRGRCLFTKNRHLQARRRCRSRSASSTIESLATLDATSTSIDAANTVTLRNGATAPITADAMIATRTGWLQSHRALESSVGQSTARRCRARSGPRPTSPNTTTKPSLSYGWRISGWHASWEVLEGTIEPSSDSFHFSSPTLLAGGSRNSQPTKSTIGPIWSGCSRATSRGPTSASAIRGTSASASRNLENLFESTLDASPSNAWSSRTSPTTTSFWRLS